MDDHEVRQELWRLIAVTIGSIIAAIVLVFAVVTFFRSSYSFNYRAERSGNIPDYSALSSTRRDILAVTEQEFNNPGDMLRYSDGVKEAWCADFVSWVYLEANHPFENPNSGSWRIPGTYTLQEYFKANNRWHAYDDELPQPGDVVIYRNGIFGDHTNIVVASDYNEILTIGGNENGKIMMHRITYSDPRYGIVGYGLAEAESSESNESTKSNELTKSTDSTE